MFIDTTGDWSPTAIPAVTALLQESAPNWQIVSPERIGGYYNPTVDSRDRLEKMIRHAETLIKVDPVFKNLGIGLDLGSFMVDEGFLGIFKSAFPPIGDSNVDAVGYAKLPGSYKLTLDRWRKMGSKV